MSLQGALRDVVSPHSTRTTGDGITSRRLGEIWPAASRRLLRVLELRGLDASNAEDLVQEVGVRAIACGVTFEGLDDFLWWAMPVVRNLHIDFIRASKWSVAAAELPDREAPAARVDHVVERRLALQSVLKHLSAMPEADREAIVAAATDAPVDAARRGTVAVRRHRARASLRRALGSALGLGGIGAFLRRLRVTGLGTAQVTAVAFALPAIAYAVAAVPAHRVAVPAGRAHAVFVEDVSGASVAARAAGASSGAASGAYGARKPARSVAATAPVVGGSGSGAVVRRSDPVYVEMKPVDDNGVRLDSRPSDDSDALICVYGGPLVHTRCLHRPGERQDTVKANVSLR